ncbi:uncharacterized protein LOC124841143, partial [Vigna umbellata]|uniref:uncharacterized protein LOC124841143 n=1 Tax=Vigna umbellata TaxID=87088 RepID=UPI001F5E5C13
FQTKLSDLTSSDSVLGNAFPAFNYDFAPWDEPDFLPFNPTSPHLVTSSFASDDPKTTPAEQKSPSDQSDWVVSLMEEQKRTRMISNMDSAMRDEPEAPSGPFL